MKGKTSRLVQFGAGLLCLLTVGSVLTGNAAKPVLEGLPTDWTHRHVIFSQPSGSSAALLANEPRFWQQEYRRSAMRVISNDSSPLDEMILRRLVTPTHKTVRADWSQTLGSGGSAGAGNFPAKYSFSATSAKCASPGPPDFVVFGTGLPGASGQASIIAFDNLYSGCTGTVPSVYWAYNTNGGKVTTSPVFSGDGDQVAFVQVTGSAASLVMLKFAASTTQTVSSPGSLTPVALASYFTCTAPCMAAIPLTTGGTPTPTNDALSSVFYDYQSDTGWVGDASGWLHKFHPVFKATPAEIRTSPWPVQASSSVLSSPVHDLVSNNVFVGDSSGFVERVNATTGAVTLSGRLDHGPAGIVAGPIVDSTARLVYVFASSDGSTGCGGTACTAVYVLSTSFAATSTGAKATAGTAGATPNPLYDGGFDSTYLASANGTGNLYVCGNTGGTPTIYEIALGAGVPANGVAVIANPLTSATTTCSSVMDIPNPNGPNGAAESLFTSVQNTGLGTPCAAGGCAMSFKNQPWTRNTVYAVGQQILDPNFRIQTVRTAGTSRPTPPTWSTTAGGITTDNTVRWINQGPLVPFYSKWQPAHGYTSGLGTRIVDSNDNIQLVITSGTSGATTPTWSKAVNGITTDNTVRWRNLGAAGSNFIAAHGGASGMVIDNVVGQGTEAGASQVYFSTLGNQTCGTSGSGGCAMQASQSALK